MQLLLNSYIELKVRHLQCNSAVRIGPFSWGQDGEMGPARPNHRHSVRLFWGPKWPTRPLFGGSGRPRAPLPALSRGEEHDATANLEVVGKDTATRCEWHYGMASD